MQFKTVVAVLLAALTITAGAAVAAPGNADSNANGSASASADGDASANGTEHADENGSSGDEQADENASSSEERSDENASQNADDGSANAEDGEENRQVAAVSVSARTGPDGNASETAVNASGDAPGVGVSAAAEHEEADEGDQGPPIDLPSNVPEHVTEIHVLIRDHIAGGLTESLGSAISSLFGGADDGAADDGGADDGAADGPSTNASAAGNATAAANATAQG